MTIAPDRHAPAPTTPHARGSRRTEAHHVERNSRLSTTSTAPRERPATKRSGRPNPMAGLTDAQIEEARALVPDPSGDPTMAFLHIRGRNLLLLAGPGSGADDLIEALGGRDAGAAADLTGAFTAISAEAMITADPDVILVMTQGAATVGGPEGVLTLPGVADTEAGRNGRVVQMDESQILAFGPEVGLVLGALARSIYA